ncbi:hypothetical protein [Thalassospira xiamenensis]|jgi:hypothetical protein|uniref:Uncharacterized protein n=1 Tax=Thalassospira xiamenensis TaxID=220697 RepID=A0A367XHM8_9PROT|nr:hypothetical protein [Thalassospira xiamenensis]KZB51057.1 hypothetical protein AUP41_08100 [Thalassospira xiamenensis]MCK2167767.1 hypothetical protein [Thalassospira xiamenensis]RCK53147.1 hypothetical protein TH44_02785 [Thalassospira xiamenensis]
MDVKSWEYAVSCYLDDEFADNLSVFLVQQRVVPDSSRIGGNVVRANARMGWQQSAYEILKRRQEYGDVGDHSLLTDEEAQEYLDTMGLRFEDGKRMLIEEFRRVNGYDPVLLPVDPKFKERRDLARERLKLPPKA